MSDGETCLSILQCHPTTPPLYTFSHSKDMLPNVWNACLNQFRVWGKIHVCHRRCAYEYIAQNLRACDQWHTNTHSLLLSYKNFWKIYRFYHPLSAHYARRLSVTAATVHACTMTGLTAGTIVPVVRPFMMHNITVEYCYARTCLKEIPKPFEFTANVDCQWKKLLSDFEWFLRWEERTNKRSF